MLSKTDLGMRVVARLEGTASAVEKSKAAMVKGYMATGMSDLVGHIRTQETGNRHTSESQESLRQYISVVRRALQLIRSCTGASTFPSTLPLPFDTPHHI